MDLLKLFKEKKLGIFEAVITAILMFIGAVFLNYTKLGFTEGYLAHFGINTNIGIDIIVRSSGFSSFLLIFLIFIVDIVILRIIGQFCKDKKIEKLISKANAGRILLIILVISSVIVISYSFLVLIMIFTYYSVSLVLVFNIFVEYIKYSFIQNIFWLFILSIISSLIYVYVLSLETPNCGKNITTKLSDKQLTNILIILVVIMVIGSIILIQNVAYSVGRYVAGYNNCFSAFKENEEIYIIVGKVESDKYLVLEVEETIPNKTVYKIVSIDDKELFDYKPYRIEQEMKIE